MVVKVLAMERLPQNCVIKWLKEKMIFELIFWIIILRYYSALLCKKMGKYKYFPRIKAIYYLSKITQW